VQDAIVLIGDSITQQSTAPYGYAQQLTGRYALPSACMVPDTLADVYQRKLDIVVRGLSGYNSTWVFPIFKKVCRVTFWL
jgi:isoamyl acetate esterase